MGLEDILPTLTWSIVLLGVCIVIIVGVGLYLAVFRRRWKAAEEKREDSKEAEEEE